MGNKQTNSKNDDTIDMQTFKRLEAKFGHPKNIMMDIFTCTACKAKNISDNFAIGFRYEGHDDIVGFYSCSKCEDDVRLYVRYLQIMLNFDKFKKLNGEKRKVRVYRSNGEVDDDWIISEDLICPDPKSNHGALVGVEHEQSGAEKYMCIRKFVELNPIINLDLNWIKSTCDCGRSVSKSSNN
jgi:hypothetical protein